MRIMRASKLINKRIVVSKKTMFISISFFERLIKKMSEDLADLEQLAVCGLEVDRC